VLFVHGIVFSHYSIQDRSAEAYAMVSAFRVGIRGSERYRTLLRVLGPHTSPLSRAFESRWTERPRAPEGTAGSPFSREQETP